MDEYLPLNRLQESENMDGLHPLYQTADSFYYDILNNSDTIGNIIDKLEPRNGKIL